MSASDHMPPGSLERDLEHAAQALAAGDPARAAQLLARLRQASPRHPAVLRLQGIERLQAGDALGALRWLRATVDQAPGWAVAHCNLGSAWRAAGNLTEATDAFRRALELEPQLAEAHNNLGALALQQGEEAAAREHFREALAISPQLLTAALNLAALELSSGEAPSALRRLEGLAPRYPDHPQVRRLAALARAEAKPGPAAVEALEALLRDGFEDAEVLHRLGAEHEALGDWDAALAAQRRALALAPDHGGALSDALFLARRLCRWDEHEPLLERFRARLEAGGTGLKPFTLLSEWSSPAEQQHCARLWTRRFGPRPPAAARRGEGPVTVGYLSNGFRRHPTACLVAELFERHAREGFRWFAYAVGPDDESPLRARIAAAVDRFRDLEGMSHGAMAEAVRADGVDVLVDLRGYGGGAVTEVFAARPAAVQVNYLAYPGTMGAAFMDYILIDPQVGSPEVIRCLDEAAVVLPHVYQPCDSTRRWDAQRVDRARCGLPEDGTVFCCFNNSYKISRAIFEAWMRILAQVPGSVLWLLEGPRGTSLASGLRAAAEARGVDPGRLLFMPKLPHADYLARLELADLFLDTLPYNAHTTAGDALWAACPVLTCRGETFAGRVAASLLEAGVGLPELVATDLDDYVARATRLGRDPEGLARLRAQLVRARGEAPLFQTERLARELEAAYGEMLRRARAGEAPESFRVASGGGIEA